MTRRFDHVRDAEAFVAAVDKGSLTAAATSLGTTPSVISRAIARLETHLGVQLLRRTTRTLGLTDPGRVDLERTRAAFVLMDAAEREIQGHGGELTGSVRLSVPTTYGLYRLPGVLRQYRQKHQKVKIELSIDSQRADLIAKGFDLAIRVGELPDSGLAARKLVDASFCLVAAPAYLARCGVPETIDDLAGHACLPFIMPSTGRVTPWALRDQGKDVDWVAPTTFTIADDFLGCAALAEHGLGIAQTYDFVAADRIARGKLIELLPQTRGRSRRFSVVYAPHLKLSAASRALIDMLVDEART